LSIIFYKNKTQPNITRERVNTHSQAGRLHTHTYISPFSLLISLRCTLTYTNRLFIYTHSVRHFFRLYLTKNIIQVTGLLTFLGVKQLNMKFFQSERSNEIKCQLDFRGVARLPADRDDTKQLDWCDRTVVT